MLKEAHGIPEDHTQSCPLVSTHVHLQEQKNLCSFHTWPSKSCGVGPGQAL